MNQLGCVGSGNKLTEKEKDPWMLRERKAKVMLLVGSEAGNGMGGKRERAPRLYSFKIYCDLSKTETSFSFGDFAHLP